MSKLVALADTHGQHDCLDGPQAKYVVYAGDYQKGHMEYEPAKYEALRFLKWFAGLDCDYKILTIGNHDDHFWYQSREFLELCEALDINCLLDGKIKEIGKLRFCGTQEGYPHKRALTFTLKPLPDPKDYDVLLTHCPARGIFDFEPRKIENCGSTALREYFHERGKPKLHIFGHIHDQYGKTGPFCNVALCDNNGKLRQKPMVIDVTHLERK